VRGYLGQSAVFGSVELSNRVRGFVGPLGEATVFLSEETFHREEDVGIPITELRVHWDYEISEIFSLGAGVETAAWWDVPVPPGVVAGAAGLEALHENTIVYLGLTAGVKLTF
jgi:hypothetical protein